MSRKRSIASLLDDLDEESPSIQSSSVAHSHRNRLIASRAPKNDSHKLAF